ncbi:MAG: hypothetical protein ACM3XM_18410 [Mycobacterium leprae]
MEPKKDMIDNTSRLHPIVRLCALCGQPKSILPLNEEHRKAHATKQIAFVCEECAAKVRTEVEAAGNLEDQPRFSA